MIEVFDDRLGCHVIEVTYTFLSRSGVLKMRDRDRCDKEGLIKMFMAIDPHVRIICTYSGQHRECHFVYNRQVG